MPPLPARSRHGFSLVELLTVIAIVGILAAIVIVSVGRVRASARDTRCLGNLRQIGMLFTLYRQDNDNRLPVDIQVDPVTNTTKTWDNYLKDYLQESSSGERAASIFGCPSVVRDASTLAVQSSYGINYCLGSNQTPRVRIPFTSIVSPGRTFLVTDSDERSFRRESQSSLQNGNGRYDIPPVGRHARRFNMLYADGSVRVLDFDAMPWGPPTRPSNRPGGPAPENRGPAPLPLRRPLSGSWPGSARPAHSHPPTPAARQAPQRQDRLRRAAEASRLKICRLKAGAPGAVGDHSIT